MGRSASLALFCELAEVRGQGQVTTEFVDQIPVDYHRAVVPDGVRIENAPQKGFTQKPPDLLAAVQVPGNGVPSPDDNQRADLLPGQVAQGPGQDFHFPAGQANGFTLVKGQASFQPPEGHPFKEVPQVFLENDHQGHQKHGEEALQQGHRQQEVQFAGDQIDGAHDDDAGENQARPPGSFQRRQEGINDQGDDKDV